MASWLVALTFANRGSEGRQGKFPKCRDYRRRQRENRLSALFYTPLCSADSPS